jgi:hypothetical protein
VYTDFELKEPPWVVSAPPERLQIAHLDFLKGYGISGGILIHGEDRAAAALGTYLQELSGGIEDGRVLVCMARDYYETWFCRIVSALRSASVPLTLNREGDSPVSPQFQGIGLCFYEDIPHNPELLKPQWDILIFIQPRRIPPGAAQIQDGGYVEELKKIKTRLRLGIFTQPWDIPSPYGIKLREFFSLRGDLKRLGNYIIRDEDVSRRLPRRYDLQPRRLRRPPRPFGADEEELAHRDSSADQILASGSALFLILAKFTNISTPEFKEEQTWFSFNGKEVPYTAYTLRHDFDLDFNRLTVEQREYFFWWRGEFRRGNPRKTCEGYILLYARELILSMGREAPRDNFRELLRLWRIYREEDAGLDEYLLPWLMDFMVLYRIWDEALPEMFPRPGEPALAFIRDIFLHKRYIEGDTPLVFADFEPLLPLKIRNGSFLNGPAEPVGPLPGEAIETALRGIDGFLRENYGNRFLEFFYPPHTELVSFPGFKKLCGVGTSSYFAERINFCEHKPLRDFLETLVVYIEYKLKERWGFKKEGREPGIEEVWKTIIDRELRFEPDKPDKPGKPDKPDKPVDRFRFRFRAGGFEPRLDPERLIRLRNESDEVRDLLHIDGATLEAEPPAGFREPAPHRGLPSPPGEPGMADFLGGLDTTQGELLRILAGDADGDVKKKALKDLAKTAMTMPEFLIDGINGQFQEAFLDILIETVDGESRVSAEYAGDIRDYFTLTGGAT